MKREKPDLGFFGDRAEDLLKWENSEDKDKDKHKNNPSESMIENNSTVANNNLNTQVINPNKRLHSSNK